MMRSVNAFKDNLGTRVATLWQRALEVTMSVSPGGYEDPAGRL